MGFSKSTKNTTIPFGKPPKSQMPKSHKHSSFDMCDAWVITAKASLGQLHIKDKSNVMPSTTLKTYGPICPYARSHR